MRKISLLVVLITMVLFSCVDDKESAVVEQIRTAKTAWLQAQAEMMKAQGEAQKILAETEKLKAENDAKNESARIEIERLKAEAEAAKTEAEADRIRAEIEKINQELEQARIEFEYQQQLNELAYQTAQAQAALKQQQFINKLNEAIVAGKLNPKLEELYDEYKNALTTLRTAENEVSDKQARINSLGRGLHASFDQYVKNLQKDLEDHQKELKATNDELKEFMASTENLTEEKAANKIKELNTEKETINAKIDAINKELIDLEKDQAALIAATHKAAEVYNNASWDCDDAEIDLLIAKFEYQEAQKGNNEAKRKVINGFTIGGQFYSFPEFEQGVETGINAAIKNLATAITDAKKGVTKAEKDLADAKAKIQKLNSTDIPAAEKALAPLEATKKDLEKKLDETTKNQKKYQADQANLKSEYDKKKVDNDTWEAKVKQLEKDLAAETDPDKKADIQIQLDLAKGYAATAKTAFEAAKKAYDTNEANLKKATEDIAELNKSIDENKKDYDAAVKKLDDLKNEYTQLVNNTSEMNNGALVVAVANAKAALEAANDNEAEFNEIIAAAKASIEDLKAAVDAAQKVFDEALKAMEEAEQAWDMAIEAVNTSAYAQKQEEQSELRKQLSALDKLITLYQGYIRGAEYSDFDSYEQYKEDQIAAFKASIEDLNKNIAEATDLLKEFEQAKTDKEKEEVLNGAGQDRITSQIESLERDIAMTKESIKNYQADVDRLQAAINAAEDALAE